MPLQYVLGTQEFGPLIIRCKPGVLAPRWETEAYCYHLSRLIRQDISQLRSAKNEAQLKVLDLCTGTGCIPLLLFALLQRHIASLQIHGIDVSEKCLRLSENNLQCNIALGTLAAPSKAQSIRFSRANVLDEPELANILSEPWDILVSNPPYISQDIWEHGRGRIGYSVRKYEPKLALVPGRHVSVPRGWEHEDIFYAHLLDIARSIEPKMALFEVGDESQARRVVQHVIDRGLLASWDVQVWRDQPDMDVEANDQVHWPFLSKDGVECNVTIAGAGNIRSVFLKKY